MNPSVRSGLALVVFLAMCFAAAGVGGIATGQSVDTWYRALQKPSWTPPSWVFGPVWTTLYAMMAVAGWLVWRRQGAVGLPLVLFGVQLVLNAAWSWLFFGLRQPGLAFAELAVLWVAIAATLVAFWRVTLPAGLLLVPYLGWSTFAAALNFTIWRLNA